MSLPRDFTVPHNVRCACSIYFSLKITDLKPCDIICLTIFVMNITNYVENLKIYVYVNQEGETEG